MSLLEVQDLSCGYGDFQALFGVSLTMAEGETLAIIGANGAGKTTLMRAICGVIPTPPGAIRFDGAPIGGLAEFKILSRGIAMVPEGRRLFPSLSVEENLKLGAYAGRKGPWDLGRIYALFPRLAELRHMPATQLSGGQQQMVAIGRALMSNPRLLLCDELSLGLAPIVIGDIYACLSQIRAEGVSVLLVEQDISRALKAAGRFACIAEGRVALQGAVEGTDRATITAAYFGV
jgi:branched-chain amino acid transport system ATP-binding protein